MAELRILRQELAGIVARQAEHGLRQIMVPKLKKSAPAIWPAINGTRQFDHGAELYSMRPASAPPPQPPCPPIRVISSSFNTPTSGIMISGTGAFPVSFATASAPSKIARACIS